MRTLHHSAPVYVHLPDGKNIMFFYGMAASKTPFQCASSPCYHVPPPRAVARFPTDVKRLQGELWDDDMSLDLDSMLEKQMDKVRLELPGARAAE